MGRRRLKFRKKVLYPLIGLALSFSAPLGWLILRYSALGLQPFQQFITWVPIELETHLFLYAYLHAGAIFTLTIAGFALGFRDDRIRQHLNKVVSQRRLLSIKNRQLARLSVVDQLTGLANRTRLLDILSLEFRRAQRYGSDLCVMVVDVDYFKRINDTYGHVFGDFILSELGQIFAGSRRETDYVARMGGEEFAFVLTQTQMQDAMKFAERLKEAVALHKFEYKGTQTTVRISSGVASIKDLDPKLLDEKGQCLYTAADEALYMAKRLGRNRVVAFQPVEKNTLTA